MYQCAGDAHRQGSALPLSQGMLVRTAEAVPTPATTIKERSGCSSLTAHHCAWNTPRATSNSGSAKQSVAWLRLQRVMCRVLQSTNNSNVFNAVRHEESLVGE